MNYKTAIYDTSLGTCQIKYFEEVILQVALCTDNHPEAENRRSEYSDKAAKQINEYLRGERQAFDLHFDISMLTDFQQAVLGELLKIPYGETRTYKQIAEAIGNPKAARAVGAACNKNPILIIIPCHRVIGTNNSLVGYASGIEHKAFLLDLEKR